MSYPNGVVVSDVPCSGHHHRYELDKDGKSTKTIVIPAKDRKCIVPGTLLKQRLANKGADRCYKCFSHDNPQMNAHPYKGGKPSGVRGPIGSKGGPPKKGGRSGKKNNKTMSAGK